MAIYFAEFHENRAAERKLNAHRKRIGEWREKMESTKNKKAKGSQRKRCEGTGENLSAKNWKNLIMSSFSKDVVQIFGSYENLL